MDPRGQYILEVITRSYQDLHVTFFGGPHAERKRAIIAPLYFKPQPEDFELTLFELQYPKKFVTIQHQHGDIIVGEDIQFVLTKQLESYIISELTRIKGASVKLNSIPTEDMIQSEENWKVHSTTVSALRLDVVLKEMIHKSRNIAQQLIIKKRVKVNHTVIDSTDFQLEQNDLLSIQGYGRAQIVEIGGKTKKNKLHIHYHAFYTK